jgi:DNA-binding MarR family transcriptional regulator
MPEDSGNFDIAPLLMLAARTQLAQMMKRLAVLGFDGLTPAFASVMPLVDAKGSRSTVLAQKAGVTKQAMSQLVKLLEQRDYVEQVADATDTRAKVIRLTKRASHCARYAKTYERNSRFRLARERAAMNDQGEAYQTLSVYVLTTSETPVVPKPVSLQQPTARPKRTNATLRGIRPSSQCRPDPASDLRISPTSDQRTPSDSPPSIF